jgi:acetylornithine deacetylase/succinyl-diaminopimelate desuccinylase-like protein
MSDLDQGAVRATVDAIWDESITPTLVDYIRIPNKSPMFDPDWAEHGYMDEAVELLVGWCREHAPLGLTLEVVRIPGRTPLLFLDVPGQAEGCVLLYGHLDKQPEMSGWAPHLGPWEPVIEGDRLYGRGGADDGYALFAAITAITAVQRQNIALPRCCVIIEACEESGSYDLPAYLDHLEPRIGAPNLVICLDSGCGNYDQLWVTTSLRGICAGTLSVSLISEGVHSGDASGLVADSFRVLRRILDRLEDPATGHILPEAFQVLIPGSRVDEAGIAAGILGERVYSKLPLRPGARAMAGDLRELVLNRTWRPALAVTGATGLPAIEQAGNVCRPDTTVKLSMRLPPTCNAQHAASTMKQLLEQDPPYGAQVRFTPDQASSGWNAPPVAPWLEDAAERASTTFFGAPAVYMGEGGTIPFMGMLGDKYPDAQIMVTGVLGPQSNAHGPNEFLHLPTGKRVTACMAEILGSFASGNP